ncbi:MAG: methionyl-tRNA formyltransferase [Bacteroidota bacterium]
MRIIFMGTPEFAVPSLQILHQSKTHEVVGVVTAPDRPAGRGRKLRASAIKEYAVSQAIPVLQPEKLRHPDFIAALEALRPDLMVVVAFRMLPKVVWDMPKIGTFNLHASLLPDYRGAAPINWVIINGETETGLTTFMIDDKIDTGSILLQEKTAIPADWTAGDLHDKLMEMGASLVLQTVEGLDAQQLAAKPQDDSLYRNPAPKIHKEDCRINWEASTVEVYNHIRGLSPYPAAWTTLEGLNCKILQVSMTEEERSAQPGTIKAMGQSQILVACQDGWLQIDQLQLAGKKRMATADFLRGYKEELSRFE